MLLGDMILILAALQSLLQGRKPKDRNLPGAMKTTVSLKAVSCGTGLSVVQKGIPEAIPVEACYPGRQESLMLPAKLVEAEIRE
jgi:hypothetical protein